MATHRTIGRGSIGFLIGVALTIGVVAAWDVVRNYRTPGLVTEACDPAADSVSWCVQLRDDGSDHGVLYIALKQGGVDVGRYTVLGSPFTLFGYREDLDVAFEADRIVVHGWRGGELVLPGAVYELD